MPHPLPPEVPAYVRQADHVSNHVTVQGGTNWDLSRSAVATPIARVIDPEPVVLPEPPRQYQMNPAVPDAPPTLSVQFGKSGAMVPANMQKLLKRLSSDQSYLVVGYADEKEKAPAVLAEKRAANVSRILRKNGKKVVETMSFGSQFPVNEVGATENRRVEIFSAP